MFAVYMRQEVLVNSPPFQVLSVTLRGIDNCVSLLMTTGSVVTVSDVTRTVMLLKAFCYNSDLLS